MIETIRKKLDEIEQKENVRILHCVESGSRAWGFASPDSDYDVRFVYVRPLSHYLRLDKTRDVIEWQLDETLDINGWDLQKTLRLLHDANPTLFEWNGSPIVYRTTDTWREISAIADDYFRRKAGLFHYLSMAKSNYREYLKGETVRLKKYLYVLRPLLACRWILDRGTPPPMPFATLTAAYLEDAVRPAVDALLESKMCRPEIAESRRIDVLNDYIERNLAELEQTVAACPDNRALDYGALNRIFLRIVQNVL